MSTEGTRRRAGEVDPLVQLQVIDTLEVGPVQLDSNRLRMPYTVHQKGEVSSTELSYRWEEDVFDPLEPSDLNLASLIGAQVALNYGLFCREIVFQGPFEPIDRTFLTDAAANTAREIYVKKLLQPNPFLEGAQIDLPTLRRKSYLQAELRFPDRMGGEARPSAWAQDATRIAVLSSGGKDSLLSYGLLREMGLETHAVFLNESGRHWYTAINAFRHLRATEPDTTAKVWTSSDRVFAWMLRRLPFVRQDFARLRADEYPIRLWTVAVFLFGALPLLRQRGITRLVIGDEFDTTHRTRHQGITHYNGLYDQSLFFDKSLSRFFHRKGWPLIQFSLLRQMSELLVEKTLVERYPELQMHQMSCHATHVEGDRVLPCGKCEKCRRIVGMLVALDADPRACGYSEHQIEQCLSSLASLGIHQESVGEQHLMWMLTEKKTLPKGARQRPTRQRDEVLKLRFEPNASPPDVVPADLRPNLYQILFAHASGAVRRSGHSWVEFVPPEDLREEIDRSPDPLVESMSETKTTPVTDGTNVLLGELSWVEARERLTYVDTALLPVGAVEQHGPHLPLDTDAWDAEHLCRRVAESCTDPKPLVLPPVAYGVSYHHDSFAGTISVGPDALADFVYDIGMSAARHGISKLVIVNGHGGNTPTLQLAAQKINRDAHIFTCVDSGETSDSDIALLTETPNDVHAGEIETSTALATRPHLVTMSKAEPAVPEFSTQYLDFASHRSVPWYGHTAKISASGVLGDPQRASAAKGERIWKLSVDHLVRFIEALKTLSLDEIYARRL